MAHISSINAGIFTYLDFYTGASYLGTEASTGDFDALFVTANDADIDRLPSIREFPSVGTPANIVNVPVFGQAISSQVQGQADAPTLEFTVNYVPTDHEAFHTLIGTEGAIRIMMAESALTKTGSTAATVGVNNTSFYVHGRFEAILVNPQLTDATTATVTMSTQSDFYGPATRA